MTESDVNDKTNKTLAILLQWRVRGQFLVQSPDDEATADINASFKQEGDRNNRTLSGKGTIKYSEKHDTDSHNSQKKPLSLLQTKKSITKWLPSLKLSDDGKNIVTLVTAYINIGTFMNDDHRAFYSPELYRTWMTAFSKIENPVVAYMNDENDIKHFKAIRANISSSATKIIRVSKDSLWSFSLYHDIQTIFQNPGYPKHSPNTYVPAYSCVMHSKYEFVAMALKSNPFNTKYFAWIDIGHFRDLTQNLNISSFSLDLPPRFDPQRVAYGEVFSFLSHTEEEVFKRSRVWVSSSFFIAKASTMKQWILQYVNSVQKYISQSLMNTDQQVIYCMHFHRIDLEVEIQTYINTGHYDPWFQLGYLCKEQGELKKSSAKTLSDKNIQAKISKPSIVI